MNNSPVILLGGSCLGPWVWRRVESLLIDSRQVHLPQLAGTGTDNRDLSSITLSTWIDDVHGYLRTHEMDDVTLIAHSFAGYVAAGLLERHPGVLTKVLFLDAAIPEPGRSWFDQAGPETTALMRSLAVQDGIPFFTDEQLEFVIPGHGLTTDHLTWMRTHLRPQPIGTYDEVAITQPLDLDSSTVHFMRCSNAPTPVGWPHVQGDQLSELAAGHWPMITDPVSLADAITYLDS